MSKQIFAETYNFGRMSNKEQTTSNLQLTDYSLVFGEGGGCASCGTATVRRMGEWRYETAHLNHVTVWRVSGHIQCPYRFTCDERDPATNGQKAVAIKALSSLVGVESQPPGSIVAVWRDSVTVSNCVLCYGMWGHLQFLPLFLEDGGRRFFENIDTCLPAYMKSHPTKSYWQSIHWATPAPFLIQNVADTFSKAFLIRIKHRYIKTWGSGGIDPFILNPDTKWRWVVSFLPWPLTPGDHLKRGRAPPTSGLDTGEENKPLHLPVIETRFLYSPARSPVTIPDCKILQDMIFSQWLR